MIPVYQGQARQYGHGLGSMFKKAMKSIKPLLQPIVNTGLQSLKKEGLRHGKTAMLDLMSGSSPKDVMKKHGTKMLKSVGEDLLQSVVPFKKKKPAIKVVSRKRKSHSKLRRRPGQKKRPRDIFDTK